MERSSLSVERPEHLKVIGLLVGYLLLGLAIFTLIFCCCSSSRLRPFKRSVLLFFSGQQSRLRGVHSVHACFLVLLVLEWAHAVTTVTFVCEVALGSCDTQSSSCTYSFRLWLLSGHGVVLLHLLTAVACVFYLRHPRSGATLRCLLTVTLWLFLAILPVYFFISTLSLYFVTASIALLALILFGNSICLCWKAFRREAGAARGIPVLLVGMVSFSVFAPAFIVECMIQVSFTNKYDQLYADLLFGSSFQLVLDGLLCAAVLMLPADEEEEEEEEEEELQSLEKTSPAFTASSRI